MTSPVTGLPVRAWRGLVWLVRLEIQMYVGLLRLVTRRSDVPAGATPHSYVGAVSALLWGFTAVSAVELVVLHVVLRNLGAWESVRLATDVLGIWGLVWCAGLTGCHYVYPHLSDAAGLRLRNAHRTPVLALAWADVERVVVGERSHDSSRALQVQEGASGPVVDVVVGSRTNVEVRLARPVAVVVRGTSYDAVAVRFFADDPRAVRAAWEEATAVDRG